MMHPMMCGGAAEPYQGIEVFHDGGAPFTGSTGGYSSGFAGMPLRNDDGDETFTTVMLRNIPNKYTRIMLIEELHKAGFKGDIDYLYLPTDFQNRCNVGYCFCNFRSPEARARFQQRYHGVAAQTCLPGFNSHKVCQVTRAKWQGREENVRRLTSGPDLMAQLSLHPDWLPLLLDEEGKEEKFEVQETPAMQQRMVALAQPKGAVAPSKGGRKGGAGGGGGEGGSRKGKGGNLQGGLQSMTADLQNLEGESRIPTALAITAHAQFSSKDKSSGGKGNAMKGGGRKYGKGGRGGRGLTYGGQMNRMGYPGMMQGMADYGMQYAQFDPFSGGMGAGYFMSPNMGWEQQQQWYDDPYRSGYNNLSWTGGCDPYSASYMYWGNGMLQGEGAEAADEHGEDFYGHVDAEDAPSDV